MHNYSWDWRVMVTKEVVEKCVEDAEERWGRKKVSWGTTIFVPGDGERGLMHEALANDVRRRVLGALTVFRDDDDEEYESQ
jgi:hypothetical protein